MDIKEDLTISKNDILKYGFHYTKERSLKKILESKRIRFSPVTKQMDLREESESYNMYAVSGDVDIENELNREKECSKAKELRSKVKMTCFSLDSDKEIHGNAYDKGWANMKMWEDYGNCYKGACLVFDIQEFIMELKSQISLFDFKHDRIIYTNKINDEGYWIPEITEENQNLSVSKDRFYSDGFLFIKPECYSFENEYRFILVNERRSKKTSFYINCESSIKAIILGFRFPKDEIVEIKKIAYGIPIFQMSMHWGIPELVGI